MKLGTIKSCETYQMSLRLQLPTIYAHQSAMYLTDFNSRQSGNYQHWLEPVGIDIAGRCYYYWALELKNSCFHHRKSCQCC